MYEKWLKPNGKMMTLTFVEPYAMYTKNCKKKLRLELIPGLANFDVAPFMSIKLGSEYESTHMLMEACYMELK